MFKNCPYFNVAHLHTDDAAARYNPGPQVTRNFQQPVKRPDDTDTVVTERTDRDVVSGGVL